ncbi:iron chelate uptake ABC transporter family permease subunit [Corynebacterium kroppenstedtii]|uniref:iron chelate uptake ABC transporter family permease subunit n=1 Tax=Corynebacterium sp. PCR 32 TaxID=3351342 RepID=UPI00309DDBE9
MPKPLTPLTVLHRGTPLVIWKRRLACVFIAVSAGTGLGLSGALMQSLTRNSLAEPGILGVNGVASAGVALVSSQH